MNRESERLRLARSEQRPILMKTTNESRNARNATEWFVVETVAGFVGKSGITPTLEHTTSKFSTAGGARSFLQAMRASFPHNKALVTGAVVLYRNGAFVEVE